VNTRAPSPTSRRNMQMLQGCRLRLLSLVSAERLGHPRRKWKPGFKEGRYPPLDVPSCSLWVMCAPATNPAKVRQKTGIDAAKAALITSSMLRGMSRMENPRNWKPKRRNIKSATNPMNIPAIAKTKSRFVLTRCARNLDTHHPIVAEPAIRTGSDTTIEIRTTQTISIMPIRPREIMAATTAA
jgi:hypothetical protein